MTNETILAKYTPTLIRSKDMADNAVRLEIDIGEVSGEEAGYLRNCKLHPDQFKLLICNERVFAKIIRWLLENEEDVLMASSELLAMEQKATLRGAQDLEDV